ncbi:MAG: FAD-binding oxidoreductase [Actinobacteria bacterium]|nr:FAD-binding oxidoreductase [Actinomycetota bacterium]
MTTDQRLVDAVSRVLPGGVRSRASDRLAYAHDASHYLLTPQAVVTPENAGDVARLLRVSGEQGIPLTFRSGGTSLSGQATTSGILVDTRRHFRRIEVLDDGRRVRVQPGATIGAVNARLAPLGYKLGPDPASESAATVGGVVANNSSGMACGTEFNSYRTIESMVLVLASGTVVDTGDPDADGLLRQREPDLHDGLIRLRDRVRGNTTSRTIIESQFSLKNTMGYGLNSFLDFDSPAVILAHLLVGSEGTLGFVAEVTFRTVAIRPHVATGLLFFGSLHGATDALPELVGSGLAAIELLDETSLRVAQRDPKATQGLTSMVIDRQAALLVEYQEMTADALAARIDAARPLLDRLPLVAPADLAAAPSTRADLWHIRKGLYATVAGARPSGTTALLEDIAVPVPALAGTCESLISLFARHDYHDSVIFGHAKDGNIHFLLNERFDDPASLVRYSAFTEDMVDLVLGHDGTLKAEHGTGRIMAPFVRRQYGDELYDVMVEVKRLLDPHVVLNPGVLLNDDPDSHLRDLKITPTVEAEVDRCVECGYCEPVCPSRDLTLTPRQRIVLRRALASAQAAGDHRLVAELEEDYVYDGVQTCAVDGMCQTACPVLIDTGDLVRRLRAEQRKPIQDAVWRTAGRHWKPVSAGIGLALDIAARVPGSALVPASDAARRLLGPDMVPRWDAALPGGGEPRTPWHAVSPAAVYFPACVNAMFGAESSGPGVRAAFLELCSRAGVRVAVPDGIGEMCCGTPWKSKGMVAGHEAMSDRVAPWAWEATRHGSLPLVCDATSCTEGLEGMLGAVESAHGVRIDVVDAVQFVADRVLPSLVVSHRLTSIALHPTCSSTRMTVNADLLVLARAIADEAVVPEGWGCCAFAGDRGLLHPELTASATAAEARSVSAREFDAYASLNRTCELGMSRATGRPYRHILELLEEATRP